GGVFQASEVLAKHDENYMPPEVAEALKMAAAGGAIAHPHAEGAAAQALRGSGATGLQAESGVGRGCRSRRA
ncbi:MAG: cytochrome c maturation protein CcmE, partial [Phycisphaerales bacterium]